MNVPHKPKLTDYLTEALAKSLTEEGRQSLLEERKLLEAERSGSSWRPSRSRRDLWTLRRLGRKPRRLLRCAPNHGPTDPPGRGIRSGASSSGGRPARLRGNRRP